MPANLLHLETSPYLLQHKDNPVHWVGWSETALKRAREENRPVLLSIGYAACHWCHVMAHESFEDPVTAELMNSNFINIKVDREERPDVDRIYMDALHIMGEQGGWPLTMFLTPSAEPFWGGTYFPPESRHGRPGFRHILRELARLWTEEPDKIASSSKAITAALQPDSQSSRPLEIQLPQVEAAASIIASAVDAKLGGLKGAPKFPQAPIFSFLWAAQERSPGSSATAAVTTTLKHICQGGIYDHLGGGLARYSVDEAWLVPHFEKMLYDNAQFISLLTRAWLRTRHELFRVRIHETVEFVLREMMTSDGAFAASYDADSEGEEGKYYVWIKADIDSLLSPDLSQTFCEHYGVSAKGNWEGRNILNRSPSMDLADEKTEAELATARRLLFAARKSRLPPAFDDKIVADWNGSMISALAEAALVFNRSDWQTAAVRAMAIVLNLLWHEGRLLHTYRAGQAKVEATADGYANLITAARALHMLTGEKRYIQTAVMLTQALVDHFWDNERGGFYFSSDHADGLITRTRSVTDDATPNANGIMIGNLGALYHLTGDSDYLKRAESILATFSESVMANPFSAPSALKSSLTLLDPVQVVTTGGASLELFRKAVPSVGLDTVFLNTQSSDDLPIHHPAYEKARRASQPQLFLCRGSTCAPPATDLHELAEALKILGLPELDYAFMES